MKENHLHLTFFIPFYPEVHSYFVSRGASTSLATNAVLLYGYLHFVSQKRSALNDISGYEDFFYVFDKDIMNATKFNSKQTVRTAREFLKQIGWITEKPYKYHGRRIVAYRCEYLYSNVVARKDTIPPSEF
jgi:hypothetical protein